ncbi:MAG: endonuclease MutS2 [Clostridiales bacterium]|nr:endonuclease MutS2 [Clostridiales bacterium]
MSINNNRHFKTLELDKILERLGEYTSCEDARRAADELEPQTSLETAKALMNQTRDAHMLLARFGGPSFGGLKNISNSLRRADAGSVLSMRELLDIAAVLRVIRGLEQWRSTNAGVETILDVFFGSLSPNKFLEDTINNAIMSEDEMSDNASPALYDIRRKIRVQESRVREQLDKLTHSQKYSKFLQESIITMRNGRFVVPVKNEHRNEVPGLVHDTSSSGATIFIEPMPVVEANNEIKVLQSKEREEIERILFEISATAGSFADNIIASYECAVELNVIFAKAHLAYSMNASVPELNNRGIINLRAARHPLIDKKSVVCVDISLGEDFDTLVITGPNTGGKTVSIKTIGLLTLMAMCGLMIPVNDQSSVSVFENILADIGDEQSIEQSLSTFSSHITNIIDIIEQANSRSLVLFDELGAGTDLVEGSALAMSVLETLNKKGAKIAATTHYAELKAYALETDRVENGCCEFDVKTLRPTYRLLIGVPGRSNAFAISERLGMDSQTVNRARELVSMENIRFEDVVDKLEANRLELEKSRNEAQELKGQVISELEKAKELRSAAQAVRDKELENAKSQALRITEQAKREAYNLMQELDKLKKERDKTKDAAELARRARATIKHSIEAIDAASDPVVECIESDDEYVLPRPLIIGDNVIIGELGRQATVLSLPDKNEMVEVQAGVLKTRVKLQGLRLIEGSSNKKQTDKKRNVSTVESRLNMNVQTKLDLRGLMVEECLLELDRFIDSSLRSGLNEFTIVHGKGTGALRAAVQKYLKGCPYVKSFRLGAFGEGESGVTIVQLK